MHKGVYVLLLKGKECSLPVGSLGEVSFAEGWYAYAGSAFGSGGFTRVKRHIMLSRKKNKSPRWHIDYILSSPSFVVLRAYCLSTNARCECRVAGDLQGRCIPGFGSSDCDCPGHLFYFQQDPHERISLVMTGKGGDLRVCEPGITGY
ncbi:MAG: DUF123 domain-containing protein [Methanospirillum sp.]|nr:DUF123 domain-containing protein [Methanospirillum sp.]